jgi:hypothetical protein
MSPPLRVERFLFAHAEDSPLRQRTGLSGKTETLASLFYHPTSLVYDLKGNHKIRGIMIIYDH